MSWQDERPTVKQLNYAKDLAEQLGIDHRYVWLQTEWTRGELSMFIDECKRKLGYED